MVSRSDSKTSRRDGSEEQRQMSTKPKQRLLDPEEAEAAGPEGFAACGEEDPGSALEFLVDEDDEKEQKKK